MYTLHKDWSLAIVDPLYLQNITCVKMKPRSKYKYPSNMTYVLVESCGEILMVRTEQKDKKVFRADLIGKVWVEVEKLADRILFSSLGGSVSICTQDCYIPRFKTTISYDVEYEVDRPVLITSFGGAWVTPE